jgi:hypothetical protein
MSHKFNENFRKMFSIIAKSAGKEDDCPISYNMMKMYINKVFTDEYDEVNRKLFKKYSAKVDDIFRDKGSSLDQAIKNKDRSIFETASLMPDDMVPNYRQYAEWMSEFLLKKMPEEHIDVIFRYIKTLKNQV